MIHQDSPLFDLSQDSFKATFFDELNTLLNIHIDPQYFEVFHLEDAIAQYVVGHQDSVSKFKEELNQKLPHLTFCGNSFYGLSVPMCIDKAKELASTYRHCASQVT